MINRRSIPERDKIRGHANYIPLTCFTFGYHSRTQITLRIACYPLWQIPTFWVLQVPGTSEYPLGYLLAIPKKYPKNTHFWVYFLLCRFDYENLEQILKAWLNNLNKVLNLTFKICSVLHSKTWYKYPKNTQKIPKKYPWSTGTYSKNSNIPIPIPVPISKWVVRYDHNYGIVKEIKLDGFTMTW
jgi:hypothetical protein